MSKEMDRSTFGEFVAALWEQQGWQTQVKRDGQKVFVAVQRPQTGEEGLLWAIPAGEGEIGGKQVQQFAKLGRQYEVEESAIVTAGAVSEHARKAASSTGVELLDGEGVAALVQQRGLEDLVRKFDGDAGGGDDGTDGNSDAGASGDASPLAPAKAVVGRVSGAVGGLPVSGTVAVAAVVVAAVLAAGVLFGPSLPIPFLGGGGDAGATGPISAAPAPNGSATLHVGWTATVVDTVDPNESDEVAYYPPEGERFVVVYLNVTHVGDEELELRQRDFKLRAGNETHGFRPLAGTDGFFDHPMGPGRNYKGWTVFTVPKGTTGTLVYDGNASVAVEFERESDLAEKISLRVRN